MASFKQLTAGDGYIITPSDGTDLPVQADCIYVGVSGDIEIITPAGTTLLFKNVPVGEFSRKAARVRSTLTTATHLVAGIATIDDLSL